MAHAIYIRMFAVTLFAVPMGMGFAHAQSSSGSQENVYEKYLHFDNSARKPASCPIDKVLANNAHSVEVSNSQTQFYEPPKCARDPSCMKFLIQKFENNSNCESTDIPQKPIQLVEVKPITLKGMTRVTGKVVEENVESFGPTTACVLEAIDEAQGVPQTSNNEYRIESGAKVEVVRGCRINGWNYKAMIKVTDEKGKEVVLVATLAGNQLVKENPGISEIRNCFSTFFGSTASTEKDQRAFAGASRSTSESDRAPDR